MVPTMTLFATHGYRAQLAIPSTTQTGSLPRMLALCQARVIGSGPSMSLTCCMRGMSIVRSCCRRIRDGPMIIVSNRDWCCVNMTDPLDVDMDCILIYSMSLLFSLLKKNLISWMVRWSTYSYKIYGKM